MKETDDNNPYINETTDANHEEPVGKCCPNINTLPRATYQKIINEPDAWHNPDTFEKVLPLAKLGLPEAQWYVGRHYEWYKGHTEGYKEQVEHWLRLSAEQHYAPAELALGEWLYYGRKTYRADPECEQWLLLAAEHGEACACYYLGELAKDKKDMIEACRWWCKGANGNDEYSQKELAFCYETGQGVPYDLGKAIEWYKRAALHKFCIGNVDACFQIAVLKKYAMEKYADLTGWESDRFWEGEKEMLNGNLAQAVSLWRWTPDPRAMVMEAWQMLHVVEGVLEKEGEEYFDDEMFFEEEEEAIKAVAQFFSKQKHPAAYYLKEIGRAHV